MFTLFLLLSAGLVLLYFGAEGLVRGASSLALRAGITPLVIRWEGAVLLIGYAGYLWWLWP